MKDPADSRAPHLSGLSRVSRTVIGMSGKRISLAVLSMLGAFVVLGTSSAAGAPAVSADPSSVVFGDAVIGMQYSPELVTLTGDDADPVTIDTVQLEGPGAAPFELQSSCDGSVLAQGDSCTIEVNFEPTTTGEQSAALRVTSDAAAGDLLILLSGEAVEPAANAPVFEGQTLAPALMGNSQGSQIWGASVGDLDNNGRDDVFATYDMDSMALGNRVGVLLSQPSGALDPPSGFDLSGGGFAGTTASGQFNTNIDNNLDVVAGAQGIAKVYLGDGEGGFDSDNSNMIDGDGQTIAVGDYDNDGKQDVLSADLSGTIEVLLGNGDGTFDSPIDDSIPGTTVVTAVEADFEGDGSSDIGLTTDEGEVILLKSNDDGTFTELQRFSSPPCSCEDTWGLAAGDLNDDGLDDLAATFRAENKVTTYTSLSNGTYIRRPSLRLPLGNLDSNPNPVSIALGDMNGDTIPDAVTADYQSDEMTVLVGTGAGTFAFGLQETPELSTPDPFSPYVAMTGDFNGDAKLDLSIASQVGEIASYRNSGMPDPISSPETVAFGNRNIGASGPTIEMIVANDETGKAAMTVSDITLGGDPHTGFSIVGTDCKDHPIPVRDFCTVEVGFTPTSAGDKTANLNIDGNMSSGSFTVPVTGTGVDPTPPLQPGITVSPTSLDLGTTTVGSGSAAKSVTVRSTGGIALSMGSIESAGANPEQFPVSADSCSGKTLAVNSTCTVSVRFTPDSAGSKTAVLKVNNNAPTGNVPVQLKGTGKAKPKPAPKTTFTKRPKKKYVTKKKIVRKIKVAFRSNQSGSKFLCKLDRKKFSKCKSPYFLKKVRPGKHVLKVKASKAGKTGKPAVTKFRVKRKK